jgi:hypothetical protein
MTCINLSYFVGDNMKGQLDHNYTGKSLDLALLKQLIVRPCLLSFIECRASVRVVI